MWAQEQNLENQVIEFRMKNCGYIQKSRPGLLPMQHEFSLTTELQTTGEGIKHIHYPPNSQIALFMDLKICQQSKLMR